MKIEFLILVNKDGSFCENEEAFINFLKVDSKIEVSGSSIKFTSSNKGDKLHVEYSLSSNDVKDKNERYFLLTLNRKEETRIDEFSELSRIIKKNVEKINPGKLKINTLWDDVALSYALKAYPIISNVENLMRKLISKFMLINVGMDWSKRALDGDLKKAIDKKREEVDMHYDDVYKLDFIHLSEILFTKYRTVDINYIDRIISSAQKYEDIKLEFLKDFLPSSNWERYFKKVIHFDEEKLKEGWKKLYAYRNKIAHNRGINKLEFESIKKLVNNVTEVLNKALENLSNIELEPDERSNVAKQSDEFIFSTQALSNILINDLSYIDYNKNLCTLMDLKFPNIKTPFEGLAKSMEMFKSINDQQESLKLFFKYFNDINNKTIGIKDNPSGDEDNSSNDEDNTVDIQ